jgi:hypothetical protein
MIANSERRRKSSQNWILLPKKKHQPQLDVKWYHHSFKDVVFRRRPYSIRIFLAAAERSAIA